MRRSWTAPCALALLALQLASACGEPKPPPTPPANTDTTAPTTRATPAGGAYTGSLTVSLLCEDEGGSGCGATYYTRDGSEPTRASPAFRDAISLSTNTTLRFFSVDKQGNAEPVKSEVYTFGTTGTDTLPPATAASPTGGVFAQPVQVTLTCEDPGGSGCRATYYTLNGTAPTEASPLYTGALALSASTTLRFFSVDAAGNAEPVRTERYVLDLAAPTTTAQPPGGSYNARQDVTLSCDDGVGTGCAATHYTLTGATPTRESPRYTPGTVLPLSANTTLKFFSVDAAGNTEPVRTQAYAIDTTAPTTTASPGAGTYNGTRSVTLTCDDAGGSGCKATYYTTNGTAPGPGSLQYSAPVSITADTVLRFLSVDTAGNAEPVQVLEYRIDVLPPVTSASPTGGEFNAARDVTLSCSDAKSGCAATYYTLDGSTPTSGSPRYTGTPLHLDTTTPLKFFSVDTVGNAEPVHSESYVIDTVAPTVSASPKGGSYRTAQSVELSCTDGTGTGCVGIIWFTTDGSEPTTASSVYAAPLSLTGNTTLRFFSRDAVGNTTSGTEVYVIDTQDEETSAQIAAVRDAPEGPIHLPIDQALITYVKPKVGLDPAGFFLQAQKNGPALFVAVDPATLSPSPLPGDRVSLVATQKAPTSTTGGQVRVTDHTSFIVHGRGESVTPLLVDASAVDLVSLIPDYESEYLLVSGTLISTFSSSGNEHQQASLSTVGNPSTPGVFFYPNLRMPVTLLTALQSRYDLNQGCSVTVTGPLWRFGTTAQPSAWREQDLQVLSCPAPRLLNAVATSATSLTLFFDRAIRPESVLASGAQFTFDNGLTATAATGVDREVRLTTSTQGSGSPYTVTVAGTVQDVMGTGVDAAARSKGFLGFKTPAELRINEVAPNLVSSSGGTIQRDVVELYVVRSGNTNHMLLTTDNFIVAVLPPVDVTAGELIVVHLRPDATTNGDAPGSETASRSEYPSASYASNYDSAWDFHGSSNGFIAYTNAVLRVKDPAGNTQDAVAFAQSGMTSVTGFPPLLQAIQAEGLWRPVDCNGVPCTYTSFPTAIEVSANWGGMSFSTSSRSTTAYRIGNTDTDWGYDWTVGTESLGLPNP